jgi:hypothetical protein
MHPPSSVELRSAHASHHGQRGVAPAHVPTLPTPSFVPQVRLPAVSSGEPIPFLQPPNQPLKKRKRKSDDEKEERMSKRILLSQQTYGLLPHQDIALQPLSRMTVAKLQEIHHLPNFLAEYQASTYQSENPMDENTVVETWQSMRLIEDQRRFHPKPTWRRVQAVPATKTEVAVADPVLYAEGPCTGDSVRSIRLQGE